MYSTEKPLLQNFFYNPKVEKILKGKLDSIPSPSPSVKIQIMGGKVCLWCKGKTLPYYPKQTFSTII